MKNGSASDENGNVRVNQSSTTLVNKDVTAGVMVNSGSNPSASSVQPNVSNVDTKSSAPSTVSSGYTVPSIQTVVNNATNTNASLNVKVGTGTALNAISTGVIPVVTTTASSSTTSVKRGATAISSVTQGQLITIQPLTRSSNQPIVSDNYLSGMLLFFNFRKFYYN